MFDSFHFNIAQLTEIIVGGAKESDIIKEALALSTSLSHEHIIQTLADLSTCIKLGNCELPIKHFK